jgi:Na+/proline symporter
MLSTRDERHSQLATLWFNVAHYTIRPWPWILVGLVAIVAYPRLDDPETGYVRVMIDELPTSLRGLMMAGFIAAFMSTISTNLNWGASYLINDVYRRFLRPRASQKQLVRASRLATVFLALLSAAVTFYMDSIAGAWKLLLATGAGTGGVLLLRWFWWRINAWSEVAAMAAAFVVSLSLQLGFGYDTDDPLDFAWVMLITVALTTLVWVATTLLTPPEPEQTLLSFYRRARPYPTLWRPIARLAPDIAPSSTATGDFAAWAAACITLYAALFAMGKFVLLEPAEGAIYAVLAVLGAAATARRLKA